MSTDGKREVDATSLGFGAAFVFFGLASLATFAGVGLPSRWLLPLVLLGLGVAGVVHLRRQRMRG